jgi:predicted RNase H-like HicB family nuclease
MLTKFIQEKLKKIRYKLLEDGTYVATIPGARGVWANAKNKKECKKEISEVLEEWVLLKVRDHDTIPGFPMRFNRRSFKNA